MNTFKNTLIYLLPLVSQSVLLLSLLFCLPLKAQPSTDLPTMDISPAQCVSVTQGDECHVDVKIRWKTIQDKRYCLKSSTEKQEVKCWTGPHIGQVTHKLVTTKPVTYTLVNHEGETIVKRQLKLMWVYKRSGRSPASWRLF